MKRSPADQAISSVAGHTFTFSRSLPNTGKTGARYVLNTARAHTHGKRAKSKITMPTLKSMEGPDDFR